MTGRKFKTIFLVSGIFSGKADNVILLGFECSINPQNLIKIVGAIFEKIKFFIFFLVITTLNFRGRRKTKKKKKARDIYKRTPDIKFERDRSIGLERFHRHRLRRCRCRCRFRRRMQCYQMESFTRSPVRQKCWRRLRHSEMQPEMISTCRRSERLPACWLQCFLMSPFTHR